MYFLEGRLERMAKELRKLIYRDIEQIIDVDIRYGKMEKNVDVLQINDGWSKYRLNTLWSGCRDDSYASFKADVVIPERFDGERTVLIIDTNKDGWNALNPQMLLYINGREYQGLDTNHRSALLSDKSQAGEKYSVFVYAFSGRQRNYKQQADTEDTIFNMKLASLDEAVEKLYYDINVPYSLLMQYDKNSRSRMEILDTLNETINLLDLRIPYSQDFYDSLQKAGQFLQNKLYSKRFHTEGLISCLGHTHIDVAWLWRYCHTREKTVRSFSTVLRLMEEYDDFTFMSSQPQLYEYIKEDHPAVYERIKKQIKDGRWEAEGGMWVEADTNVPSGESLVRQFVYGKKFFKEEFGIDSEILWLPDVFGYSAALPQIMKKCGINYFMTAKLSSNEVNKFPYHTFIWRGLDGSEVLSHLHIYSKLSYIGHPEDGDIYESWKNYAQKDINEDVLLLYGYGDGGGGPTAEMIESVKRYNKGLPGAPRIKNTKAGDYFKKLFNTTKKNKRLPRWSGELYYEYHRGTYTSMARNKKFNRKAEVLFSDAECASSLSSILLGSKYPSAELSKGWKKILLNQFHDVLPGTSIKEVYEDTDKIYSEVFEIGNDALISAVDRISSEISTKGRSLIVFNSLSWERDGLVEFELDNSSTDICLRDMEGKLYDCQTTDNSKYISIIAGIPPKGYKTLEIVSCSKETKNQLIIDKNGFSNKYFKVIIDENGRFKSIYDKRTSRELLQRGKTGNNLVAFEDKPVSHDNWNLDVFYTEKRWDVTSLKSIEVLESGPVRGVIRMCRSFSKSDIMQDVIFYSDIPRIDFSTKIEWNDTDIVLKAEFPLDVFCDKATYEIQYGSIERNTHQNTTWDIAKFEVCGHKWADISEAGYGVSLLNDCKYGYDIKDGVMRLTLLRSGCIPNPDADKEYHEFVYALYPHLDDWRRGETVQRAYELNYHVVKKNVDGQSGSLPLEFSLIRFDCPNVIAEVIKQAEDGNGFVLRVYEAHGRRSRVTAELSVPIGGLEECNMLEEKISDRNTSLKVGKNCFAFTIKPFEIKTFRLKYYMTSWLNAKISCSYSQDLTFGCPGRIKSVFKAKALKKVAETAI